MSTKSIKSKYTQMLVSWGIINFYGPIIPKKTPSKLITEYKNKQPIRISDINLVRGLN